MFGYIKNASKVSAMAARFGGATGVDPGDNGQVTKKAMEYINNLGLEPGDAWLTALINWMNGMPWPDSQEMLARAINQFLDAYEGKVALSAVTILSARAAAEKILRANY